RENQRHGQVYELSGQRRQAVVAAIRPPESDREVPALNKPGLAQSLAKGGDHTGGLAGRSAAEESDHRHRTLLCPHRARPRGCAAQKRDERAPLHLGGHSITSSARPSSGSGNVIPSALAVLRLSMSSTLMDCWTGRSAGLSPLRTRAV